MMVRGILCAALALGACGEQTKNKTPIQEPTPTAVAAVEKPTGEEPEEHQVKAVPKTRVETIQFPAADGLLVTADLYLWHEQDAPFIVLFHQAGWSRGEYKEIAPKLGELGFNCMAVDLRAGKEVGDVVNETHALAVSKKLGTEFLDALPDMRAALGLVKTRFPAAKRIAWGSSFSSALTLVLAGEEPDLVDAALAFSPAEYFMKFGKSKSFVQDAASKIKVPVFITATKKEHKAWKAIYEAIPSESKQGFVPETAGNHGSRALWDKKSDSEQYWDAVREFLKALVVS